MKIKDLIKKLQEYDEEIEVVIYDWEDNTYDNSFEFSKEIESYCIWSDWKPIWSRIDKNEEMAYYNTRNWKNKIKRKDILVIYADY